MELHTFQNWQNGENFSRFEAAFVALEKSVIILFGCKCWVPIWNLQIPSCKYNSDICSGTSQSLFLPESFLISSIFPCIIESTNLLAFLNLEDFKLEDLWPHKSLVPFNLTNYLFSSGTHNLQLISPHRRKCDKLFPDNIKTNTQSHAAVSKTNSNQF